MAGGGLGGPCSRSLGAEPSGSAGRKRFFRKLLKGLRYSPRVLITDKLKIYAAAKRKIMPGIEHRQHKGLNNRAEVSHPPTRQQERQMRRFKSPRQTQRFLAAHAPINNLFRCQRHRCSRADYYARRRQAFQTWHEIVGTQVAS